MRMEGVITVNAISGICRAINQLVLLPSDNGLSRFEKLQCFTGHAHFAFAVQQRSVLKVSGYLQLEGRMPPPGSPAADFPPPALTVASG